MRSMVHISLLILLSNTLSAQSLRDINYRYLYDSDQTFRFAVLSYNEPHQHIALFTLTIADTLTLKATDFTIQWEVRNSLSDKEGRPLAEDSVRVTESSAHLLSGAAYISMGDAHKFLVARVVNNRVKRAWIFYTILQPRFPVNGFILANDMPLLKPYATTPATVKVGGNDSVKIVSYYNDDFPAATPAYAEGVGKVSRVLQVDSTFTFSNTLPIVRKGLYLIQSDTAAAYGIAFRAEDDYPKFARVENLADPMKYISTAQEFQRIKLAKGDKRAFDKVILSITGNADRARSFMRSYFKRVELANQYFTSYKEGWKTDRGMIYIIFGTPDEVFKLNDRELWNYKNDSFRVNFEFIKSPTIFDPDNYVLIRYSKYRDTWLQAVDLWRAARF